MLYSKSLLATHFKYNWQLIFEVWLRQLFRYISLINMPIYQNKFKLRRFNFKFSLHHFMANRWGKSGNRVRFYFLGSKITVDGDFSHEIKRRLLLGRKAMTNLDSVLESRDIPLLIKVPLVKAMIFPVVMDGCESWTIKKAERQWTDAVELWCWRRLLRVSWLQGDPTSQS